MKHLVELLCGQHEDHLAEITREGNDHGNGPRKNLTRSLSLEITACAHLVEAIELFQKSIAIASRDEILSDRAKLIESELVAFFGKKNTAEILQSNLTGNP